MVEAVRDILAIALCLHLCRSVGLKRRTATLRGGGDDERDAKEGGSQAGCVAGNLDQPVLQPLDRMVRAAVALMHLDGLCADGKAQQLVAKADAEHGCVAHEFVWRDAHIIVVAEDSGNPPRAAFFKKQNFADF